MPFVPDWFFGSDTLFAILIAAFLLDAVAGSLPGIRHLLGAPAALARAVASAADKRLNRSKRSARSRRVRGALVVLIAVPLAAVAGYHGAALCRAIPDGWLLETLLIAMCVGFQRPVVAAASVRRALARSGIDKARAVLARATVTETAGADEHGLARGSVELFAVRLCDGLVGPVFWYALAGLPGLFAYRVIVSMADALAHPTSGYAEFGAASAALDRLVNPLPAPMTGALIVIGLMFSPTARPLAAVRGMLTGARIARLPREGWTQGAISGALGLSLAGPRRMHGELSAGGWIGDGRARATTIDITRATWLYMISVFIGLVPIGLLALLVHRG